MNCYSFDFHFQNVDQRQEILKLILQSEPTENVDIGRLASDTDGFSGSDLRELCRHASTYRVRDYARSSSAS